MSHALRLLRPYVLRGFSFANCFVGRPPSASLLGLMLMIIATRVLTLSSCWRRGPRSPSVSLLRSRNQSIGNAIEIDGEDVGGKAPGLDAVQALELALKMIGALIYASDHHASGRLMWLEPGKGYGFPVTSGIRDLVVGEDKGL